MELGYIRTRSISKFARTTTRKTGAITKAIWSYVPIGFQIKIVAIVFLIASILILILMLLQIAEDDSIVKAYTSTAHKSSYSRLRPEGFASQLESARENQRTAFIPSEKEKGWEGDGGIIFARTNQKNIYTITFPEKVSVLLGDGTEKEFDIGSPSFEGKDSSIQDPTTGAYYVAMGPRVFVPDYSDSGNIGTDAFPKIPFKAVFSNGIQEKVIDCMYKDAKAHLFNKFPYDNPYDSAMDWAIQEHDSAIAKDGNSSYIGQAKRWNPLPIQFKFISGIIQTGIAYPNSGNAKRTDSGASKGAEGAWAFNHVDFSIIEFYGKKNMYANLDLSGYRLTKLIVDYGPGFNSIPQ